MNKLFLTFAFSTCFGWSAAAAPSPEGLDAGGVTTLERFVSKPAAASSLHERIAAASAGAELGDPTSAQRLAAERRSAALRPDNLGTLGAVERRLRLGQRVVPSTGDVRLGSAERRQVLAGHALPKPRPRPLVRRR